MTSKGPINTLALKLASVAKEVASKSRDLAINKREACSGHFSLIIEQLSNDSNSRLMR